MIHGNLGTKRPGVNTSPKAVCKKCGAKKFKREFRLKSGRIVRICRDCRRLPKVSTKAGFERHLLAIRRLLTADYIEQKTKNKEVKTMGKVTGKAREYANQITELPDKIAIIVGKTYSVRGDDFKLNDDEALTRIRDLLEEIDDRIIARNKNKKLP